MKINTTSGIIKRTIAEAIFAGICIFVFGSISLWLGSMAESSEQELQQARNESMSKTAEIQTLQAKMSSFKNALPIWNGFKNNTEPYKFTLSRDEATNIFMELRDLYAFKDIQLTISPIRPSDDQTLIRPNLRVMMSDINVTMRAYSDEQVLMFVEDLKKRLPGVIKVRTLRMFRNIPTESRTATGAPSNSNPARLNEPQMNVTLTLAWYGMEEIVVANPAAGGGAPGMAATPGMPGLPPGAMR